MKEFFKPWNPTDKSLALLETVTSIIEDYIEQGYTLSLRQIYYKLVTTNTIENTKRSYKNLGNFITNARVSGKICWDAIEDRRREFNDVYFNDDAAGLVEALPEYFALDYWKDQPYYIEVWVEKEALGNVIERACTKLKLPHMACIGYLSSSEAYRAGKRFEEALRQGKECRLVHLGDHDPSGMDMTRDNNSRTNLFANSHQIKTDRVALNYNQILEFSLPPNPSKKKDSRFKEYVEKYGTASYELDALEPRVIESLIIEAVTPLIDTKLWNEVVTEEQKIKESLKGLVKYL